MKKGEVAHNITPPGKEADYFIQHLAAPGISRESKAAAAGIGITAAKAIERRIEERYAELAERVRPISRDILERRVCERLDIIDAFLTTDKFLEKLEKTSLKDIGIYEGILMDKLAQIRAAPSTNLSHNEQIKLDQLAPALLDILKQRGLTATATERRIEFTTNAITGPDTGQAEPAERPGVVSLSPAGDPAATAGPPTEPVEILPAGQPTGA